MLECRIAESDCAKTIQPMLNPLNFVSLTVCPLIL